MAFESLDLFFGLLGASVTLFLAVLVYYHDRRSATNRIFIIHSVVGALWSLATYFSVVAGDVTALFWIRGVLFFAVPHVFLFYLFVRNFPNATLKIPPMQFWFVLLLMAGMMALTITPYVFEKIKLSPHGIVPVPGALMPFFGPTLVIFFLLTTFLVFRRYFGSQDVVRRQWLTIGIGLLAAYTLLIFFVFLRVIVFDDTSYVPYSPLFILPIFAGAAYAVLRHHLFNMKIIATEVITFLLLVASLVQIFLAGNILGFVLALAVFIFLLYFGILLIKSVLLEVRQREELQVLTKQLESANQQLTELSRFKTQLLSLASHQIKSPLAAIKGFVTLLLEGAYGPLGKKPQETLVKVKSAANQLIDLINTLLDLRRVEEGKLEYQFEKVDLKKLIQGIIEEIEPLAKEKGLELSFHCSKKEVFVSADKQKFRQVVQNLVDNAIKYTPSGHVWIDLKDDGKKVLIAVSDTGLGIPADLLPHLFEEFIRDERVKREILGTGFGLYIARKIVEAHGGKIWAKSEGEKKGSKFFVELRGL